MSRKKKNLCSICKKEKEIIFEGEGVQYPVFSCPEHGSNKRNEWKLWWDKYRDLWKEKKYWDSHADKLSCLVGYFCHKYKEFYNTPYVFGYANPVPYKDKDFVMARRLLAMFNGNAHEIRVYIKWVFKKIIKTPSYTIHSLGFFVSAQFVNEYLQAKKRSKVLRRSTKLPMDFLNWCKDHVPDIFEKQELGNWNDLNGLVTHIISYGSDGVEGQVVKEAVKRGMLENETTYKVLEG